MVMPPSHSLTFTSWKYCAVIRILHISLPMTVLNITLIIAAAIPTSALHDKELLCSHGNTLKWELRPYSWAPPLKCHSWMQDESAIRTEPQHTHTHTEHHSLLSTARKTAACCESNCAHQPGGYNSKSLSDWQSENKPNSTKVDFPRDSL